MLAFALYLLYAFSQAILTARYVWTDDKEPVFWVVLMTGFAPITTFALLVTGFTFSVKWLVTYKPKKNNKPG